MKCSSFKYFLMVLSLLAYQCIAADYKLKNGEIPPDCLGKDLDGKEVLVSDHKGKLVVVTFWASWCAPCHEEIPVLARLQRHLGSDIIKVVAVNFKESLEQYQMITKAINSPAITLTHDKDGSIGEKFGIEGIPHLIIIGKEGKIVHQSRGYGKNSIDMLVDVITKQL